MLKHRGGVHHSMGPLYIIMEAGVWRSRDGLSKRVIGEGEGKEGMDSRSAKGEPS